MLTFKIPTLISLTAPTCAGKNYLLEGMVEELEFNRIVGTTDRAPRAGEIEGVHYAFLSTAQAVQMIENGEFAEHVQYNGVRYGVTHKEMEAKMTAGRPPIVILEPNGVELYRKYCISKGWQLFTVFVNTPENTRLERLSERTTSDIMNVTKRADVHKIVTANNKRLTAVIEQERLWIHTNVWNCIVPGTDIAGALDLLQRGVLNRNVRSDIYI